MAAFHLQRLVYANSKQISEIKASQ